MHVEEVDARTAPDEVLLRFHALEAACQDELRPREPLRDPEETIAFYRFRPATHTSCLWLADGGGAALYVHNPTTAFVDLLVAPARRRRGIGSALLERVLERCRELGVEGVHGDHATAAGAAFAAAVGASDKQRILRSLLGLREAALPEPAPPEGFRLVTWLGRVPDEHLAAYVRARAAMDDAPDPEGMDYPTATAETVRAAEASLAQRGREMRLTVALGVGGEIAAFSDLRVSPGSRVGFTDDTGTVAEQRGRGLARAVKLESLRRLRADHPRVDLVVTMNAEENAAMRHINESIGFRVSAITTTAALLAGPDGPASGQPR